MLYLSTCVGFGYGLRGGYFLEPRHGKLNPVRAHHIRDPSLPRWLTNINVIPIDYAFRPRLRDRLTLRRLTSRRNPWTFGDTVFHSVCRYSCQHSHFRCLQRPSRVLLQELTERSATVQVSDDRCRVSERKSRHGVQACAFRVVARPFSIRAISENDADISAHVNSSRYSRSFAKRHHNRVSSALPNAIKT